MHLTLREILAKSLTIRLAAMVGGGIVVCVVAGPFHTLDMPFGMRFAYWTIALTVAAAMSITIIGYAFVGRLTPRAPLLVRAAVGALLFSLLYAAVLIVLGDGFLGYDEWLLRYPEFLGYVAPIAVGITFIVYLFKRDGAAEVAEPASQAAPLTATPRILSRIKPGLGARLMRLTVRDHYVEVFTDKGSQLVLMRFADALNEVSPTPGWRIHRSHWVAEAAMADIRRVDGKTFAVLQDGSELPISRTYLPKMRDAGVLRRFG